MATNPPELPSEVEEILSACPQFRILVVGNTGVGKSSLVKSVFNLDIKDIDIAHGRVGEADITHPYTSSANPRFILHDSKGFEPGSENTWNIVEGFIRDRCSTYRPLKDRVHTIWLCIQTPRTGSRLVESGDQKLLDLALEFEVPVIVVFTKYDIFVNEKVTNLQKRKENRSARYEVLEEKAEGEAAHELEERLDKCSDVDFKSVEYVKVSTDADYGDAESRVEMLKKLAKVTRTRLQKVEEALLPPWAVAQQVHAQQKVELSIKQGYKKYWVNLGKNAIFYNLPLESCVARIRDDILLVWNFHDPENSLSSLDFSTEMFKLIEPLLRKTGTVSQDMLSSYADAADLASHISSNLAQALSAAGIAIAVVKFLVGRYRDSFLTALCLGAYIVDFTLILHRLFLVTLNRDPPRPVSKELAFAQLENYRDGDAERVHGLVQEIVRRAPLNPVEKIVSLIREELGMETGGS